MIHTAQQHLGSCKMLSLHMSNDASSLSGALVDIFGDYKYMYFACGVFMLTPGIFFFIMNYYNYKKLDEEQRQSVAVKMRTSEEAVQLKSQDDKTAHETNG